MVERTGREAVWVRVVPSNAAALRLYESQGFVRAPDAEQREHNAPQPRDYVWLKWTPRSQPPPP